jgi:four helix bundle protein
VVNRWKFFEKDTVGKQLVRAVDSIAANLSEGLGRYHFKETKNFGYYSRGSLFETKTWLTKARNRRLIDEQKFNTLIDRLETIGKMLNGYINSIGVQEPEAKYGSSDTIPNTQSPIPNA